MNKTQFNVHKAIRSVVEMKGQRRLRYASKHTFKTNKVYSAQRNFPPAVFFTGSMACFSLFFHSYMSTESRTLVNKAVRETDQLPGWMSDSSSVVWSPSVSTNHSLL